MVEGAALEMLCSPSREPRVRIPNSPPNIATSPEVANKKEHFCCAPFFVFSRMLVAQVLRVRLSSHRDVRNAHYSVALRIFAKTCSPWVEVCVPFANTNFWRCPLFVEFFAGIC